MMGYQSEPQEKLFHYGINLEQRIRRNHPLRKIAERIDFDFTYQQVKDSYGVNGNVSVPPPVILKLMLLLILYNVRSERELLETVPERLDWLWFLGYDLEATMPDHSVLSKARRRWGVEVFRGFFERVVLQCVEADLVDGRKLFVDASLIEADASNNSVVDTMSLRRYLRSNYDELERRLDQDDSPDSDEDDDREDKSGRVNRRYVSTTDPDASIVRRRGPRLRYQAHRAVDAAAEIITATEVKPAEVNEAERMIPLLEKHQQNTKVPAEVVVADSAYGTNKNLLGCKDRGVRPHIPSLKRCFSQTSSRQGIFSEGEFRYCSASNTYTCPAGKTLKLRSEQRIRQSTQYVAARSDCACCALRPRCTRSKTSRTVNRHFRHDDLEQMLKVSGSAAAKKDIETRQHLIERSFAVAQRYGLGRARWRRLWRVQIQEYLTATIQNIQKLLRYGGSKGLAVAMPSWRRQMGVKRLSFTLSSFALQMLSPLPDLVFIPD